MNKDNKFIMTRLQLIKRLTGTPVIFTTTMTVWLAYLMPRTTDLEFVNTLPFFALLILFVILDFGFYKFLFIKSKKFANYFKASLTLYCTLITIVLFTEPNSIWEDLAILIHGLHFFVFCAYTMKTYNEIIKNIPR